jgi:hypothetical protein
VGDFVRIEGPPGLRRAVGRVVRLQPTDTPPVTGVPAPRAQSVALEPETVTEDPEGEERPPDADGSDDGGPAG